MDPSTSVKTCNAVELNSNQDLISNLPDIAVDKILKLLPLKMVAKMSILSRRWRQIWLSLKHVVFDYDFWDEIRYKSHSYDFVMANANFIISNILLLHVGRVHEFHLSIPHINLWRSDALNYGGWVSLLSKVGIKKIAIVNRSVDYLQMPSYIFDCKDLVKLKIDNSVVNYPPSHFEGFAHLQRLEVVDVKFKDGAFRSLIAYCPRLTVFKLVDWNWNHAGDIVIDMPCVEHLTIEGEFDTIVFKNVQRLGFLSLSLRGNDTVKGLDQVIETLASSCQLKELHFGDWIYASFGAGCLTMSLTLQYLHRLCLTEVDLSDSDTFCFTLGLVQCCPLITDLNISVRSLVCEFEDKFDYTNKNCELKHLIKVKITGFKGLSPELQLIEFLLSSASKLEKLAFSYCNIWPNSEPKMIRYLCHLLEFPRASPKAKLVCLENKSM